MEDKKRLRMTLDRIGMALGDAPPPPSDPAPTVVDTVDAQFMEAMQEEMILAAPPTYQAAEKLKSPEVKPLAECTNGGAVKPPKECRNGGKVMPLNDCGSSGLKLLQGYGSELSEGVVKSLKKLKSVKMKLKEEPQPQPVHVEEEDFEYDRGGFENESAGEDESQEEFKSAEVVEPKKECRSQDVKPKAVKEDLKTRLARLIQEKSVTLTPPPPPPTVKSRRTPPPSPPTEKRRRTPPPSPPPEKSRSRSRSRSKSKKKKRSRSRDRKRSRSKSKKRKRSKSRDRRRSRSREKKRSRSRESRRSRSRDRKRSRSKERKRSRSRDRKRSKSRERKRSRSRERKRSRSRERKRSRSRGPETRRELQSRLEAVARAGPKEDLKTKLERLSRETAMAQGRDIAAGPRGPGLVTQPMLYSTGATGGVAGVQNSLVGGFGKSGQAHLPAGQGKKPKDVKKGFVSFVKGTGPSLEEEKLAMSMSTTGNFASEKKPVIKKEVKDDPDTSPAVSDTIVKEEKPSCFGAFSKTSAPVFGGGKSGAMSSFERELERRISDVRAGGEGARAFNPALAVRPELAEKFQCEQPGFQKETTPLAGSDREEVYRAVQIGPIAPLPSGKFGGASGKEREMAWRAEQGSEPSPESVDAQWLEAMEEEGKLSTAVLKPGQEVWTWSSGSKLAQPKARPITNKYAAPAPMYVPPAPKVSGGFGERLLQKMGWSEGEGLGKERNGITEPIVVECKVDKKGVGLPNYAVKKDQCGKAGKAGKTAVDQRHQELGGVLDVPGILEVPGKTEYGESGKAYHCQFCNVRLGTLKIMGDHCLSKKHRRLIPREVAGKASEGLKKAGLQSKKHPVSYLLEICHRRKWPNPEYSAPNELPKQNGLVPPGGWVMEVVVNGNLYRTPEPLNMTKKEAKSMLATHVLTQFGLKV